MVDAQGKTQNGFLRANDIYNLKLPAELVVLSACQTGLGKEIKGEGLVGLTRGFMYAGAARVVVSLWNVNDKATADLMTKFYEKMLKQGAAPSGGVARCAGRDVEAEAVAVAVLLGRVHDAGRVALGPKRCATSLRSRRPHKAWGVSPRNKRTKRYGARFSGRQTQRLCNYCLELN